ncbi:MAG: PEP-CTERM sorting domain-containing protein [Methyloversatilis sp.]|nr:PEP-CTERM sorting domain-containing protein [Methyloversatilis sp.]MCR6666442.1 PEP-CTERM sorting domain-containing protein [Methyloversatilis sp.]
MAAVDSAVVGPVPEPGVWALLAAGLGVVAGVRRRRKD